MEFNHKQKKYIKKYIHQKQLSEIASELHVPQKEIEIFLRDRWGEEEFKKFLTPKDSTNSDPFSIKKWIKTNTGYLLLLSALVFICYLNALGNGFTADDRGIVLHVPSIRFFDIFTRLHGFRDLFYFAAYQIGGLNPFLFRLPNIFFHLGNVLLIFFILSKMAQRRLAFLASILFAVHPILVESVTWIAGGVYAQYSFFFLLSFAAYLFSKERKRYYIYSLIFFALSVASSEKAIVLVLTFPLYEVSFGSITHNWKKMIPFFLISLTVVPFQLDVFGAKRATYLSDSPPEQIILNPFLQIPIAISSYFELIFWPDKLTLYHTEMFFTQLQFAIKAIVSIIFFGFLVFTFIKNRLLFFWLSFFLIFLSLTLLPLGISWIVAERYVYLGTIGIFLGISWIFVRAMNKSSLKPFAIGLFSLIILVLAIRTIARNVDWYNEDNLWVAAARTSPSSSQNHNNLGDYYGRHGDLVNSEKEFKTAIAIKPNYADAWHNLGNVYRDMGKTDDAIKTYEKALSFNPQLWQSYQNIALIYYQKGEFVKAKENVEKGLQIDKQNATLFLMLGLIDIKTGEKVKAKEILQKILTIDPSNQLAQQGLQEITNPQLASPSSSPVGTTKAK